MPVTNYVILETKLRDLSLGRSTGHDNDFAGHLLLLHPDCLLDRDLVERVHRVFDALRHDAGLVRLHPDLDGVVDDALDANHHSKG